MAPIVSTRPARPGLAGVLTGALAAVLHRPDGLRLGPRERVLVVVVDGLGAEALAARAGHARTLVGASRRMDTGCPTTTAAALTTLTTGEPPGRHGLIGFAVRDPGTGEVVGQLRGYDVSGPPVGWQRCETVFERAVRQQVAAVAAGPRHYAGSAFTAAALRGAAYVGARTIPDRFRAAAEALRRAGRGVAYVYVPELDQTAHREGWSGSRWTADLEEVDAAVAAAAGGLRRGETLLVTADHGILDVPPARHVILEETGLLDEVVALAGEPRLLQVHLRAGRDAAVEAARWAEVLGGVADVRTRAQAVEAGWYGEVDDAVLPRLGDVLVAARGDAAFYGRADSPARGMVGQHGAWTDAERFVPFIRFDG